MPPAPAIVAPSEIEAFLKGLIESKVLDGGRVRTAWEAYRNETSSPDLPELAEFLVHRGLLTPYQAECGIVGEAGKLLLGPYMLLEPLGSTRFGTGFLAVHRGDRRRFAVTVLPIRSLWKVLQAKRQATRFGTLPSHRAIVPLAEIDTANGSHYLSWEFVGGDTLAELLDRSGPLSPNDACRFFAEVAEGLAVCHAAGLFHGLLCPANLKLGNDGGARILDLGLGAILAENMDDESMLDTMSTASSAREMMDYCAPETIADPTVRNAAADGYSLGCVLYAVVTGARPFPGGTVVDKMIAHQTRSPLPIRSLNPAVPPALESLIHSLLNKDPASRPGLREVKNALEAMAVDSPVDASFAMPFGVNTLGIHGFGEQLSEAVSSVASPDETFTQTSGYTPSRVYESAEGSIHFDVPSAVSGAVAARPISPSDSILELLQAPREAVPASPKTAENGSSVPDLLLPGTDRFRRLSLPNPLPIAPVAKPTPPLRRNWVPLPAPVDCVSTTARSECQSVRPPVLLPPPPQFGSARRRGFQKQLFFWKPAEDTVQISVFGTPEIARGERVDFLVYAHSPQTHSDVATLCRAMRSHSELLGAGYLEVPVRRGIEVSLHMALAFAGVATSQRNITWIGQTQLQTFEVFVPWESPPGLASGVVTAGIDKTMVASIPLHFVIPNRRE